MGTTSQHQLSSFASPVNGTSPIDANTVRGNDNSIRTSYNAHDADTTIHVQNGAVATRPAASTAGQMWLANDSAAVYLTLDTGSAWVDISYLKLSGGTLTGGLTVSSGGLTVSAGTTAVQALTATTATISSTLDVTTSGFAIGNVAARRRIVTTGASAFVLIGDDNGNADLTLRAITATGTVAIGSDFAINTNKFTVTASNGNTAVAGSLVVNGGSLNFSNFVGTQKIIGGTTGIGFRNNADSATIVNIDNAGAMNVSSDFSVATSKFTVAASTGNTVVAGTLGVTSDFAVATTKFTVAASTGNTVIAGTLTLGATSNIAVNTNKFTVTASTGDVSIVGGLSTGSVGVSGSISTTASINAGTTSGAYQIAGTQVVSSRVTGWTAATGTPTRTAFATSTVTLSVLAEHVKALIDDLITHGLIGT